MALQVKKLGRMAVYAFLLALTALLSTLLGSKKEESSLKSFSLIPPVAHADITTGGGGGGTDAGCSGGGGGGGSDSGGDSGTGDGGCAGADCW